MILLILFVPVAVALIAGELYLRLLYDLVSPETIRASSPRYEPALFARHVFARQEVFITDRAGAHWRINPLGYLGPDFSPEKPEGMTRLIFYGGSFVFDTGSRGELEKENWPRRVERILRERGFAGVEVVNAGIPGHASYDAFGRFFAEGHNFDADYVLICNAWNDIKDFGSDDYLLRRSRPVPARDYRVEYLSWPDRVLSRLSQVYVRLRYRYYNWKYGVTAEGAVDPGREPAGEVTETALRQYRVTMELFVDLARNIGAVPVLMTQPRLVSPDNTPQEKQRIGYDIVGLDHDELLRAFELTDGIIREIAREKEVALIDASELFTGRGELFVDHVHLSDRGADAVADAVAVIIENLLREI